MLLGHSRTKGSESRINYKVADLVLGPGRDGKTIQPEGIKSSGMNASQQAMMLDLIGEWAGIGSLAAGHA